MSRKGRPRSEPLPERLFDKVDVTATCWLWTGSINNAGYGRISVNNRPKYAHRVMYELVVGPIPDGLHLDHLCRVRHCVNPDHLEPVTNRENTLGRGLGRAAIEHRERQRTGLCSKGHSLRLFGKLRDGGTKLYCGECARQYERARRRAS